MSRFDPATSILAGLDTGFLQAQLTALQTAYLALSAGAQVATATYTQGDGVKSVTYTATQIGQLSQAIRLLQAQLGVICTPRHAIGARF